MSVQNNSFKTYIPTSAEINRWRWVSISGTANQVVQGPVNAEAVGIAYHASADTVQEEITVVLRDGKGVCYTELGADNMTAGTVVKSDATGRSIAADGTNPALGILEQGGSTGDIVKVLLQVPVSNR